MQQLLGKQIGQYQIQALLGQGGMGAVYRAHDLQARRSVALKVMHPHLAEQPPFRRRFLQEASIGRLQHQAIVKIYEHGESGGYLYIAMELINGNTLTHLLRQYPGRRLPITDAVTITAQIADALNYAHQQKILHRDIKPDNILIKQRGGQGKQWRVVITDFGLMTLMATADDDTVDTNHYMGSPEYMSPEQCLANPLDGRSDIYALGIVLYQLITGRLPFTIDSLASIAQKHVHEPPTNPRLYTPELSHTVEQVILQAIAKKPSDRYPDAAAFARALRQATPSVKPVMSAPVMAAASLATTPKPANGVHNTAVSTPPAFVGTNGKNGKHAHTRLEPKEWVAQANVADRIDTSQTWITAGDYRLLVAHKWDKSRTYALNQRVMTIGRGNTNQIRLTDDTISNQHIRLEQTVGGWQVIDVGSTNGTYLEQQRLVPNQPNPWLPHQTLRIGPYFLQWQAFVKENGHRRAVGVAGLGAAIATTNWLGTLADQKSGLTSLDDEGLIKVNVQSFNVEVSAENPIAEQILYLENNSHAVENFEITVRATSSENVLHPTWVTVPPDGVALMPGQSREVPITFQPPLDSTTESGRYDYQITIRTSTGQQRSVSCWLTIGAFGEFDIDMFPSQISAGDPSRVTIENHSNESRMYTVAGRHEADQLIFRFGNSAEVELETQDIMIAPGQTGEVDYTVRPKRRRLLGKAQIYDFVIAVSTPQTETPKTLPGHLEAPARISWLTLIIALFILGLLALGGWAITRQANISANASLQATREVERVTLEARQTEVANNVQEISANATANARDLLDDIDGLQTRVASGDVSAVLELQEAVIQATATAQAGQDEVNTIQTELDQTESELATQEAIVAEIEAEIEELLNPTPTSTPVLSAPTPETDTNATDEDTILNVPAPGLLANDVDINLDDVLEVEDSDSRSFYGALVVVNENGSYTYNPTGAEEIQALKVGEVLTDTFTYIVRDSTDLTAVGRVSILVSGLRDYAVAEDDSNNTNEDTPLNVDAEEGVLINDSNIEDNNALSVIAFDPVSRLGATVSVNTNGSYSYNPSVSEQLQLLNTDETLLDSFTYTIQGGDGQTDLNIATVTISVAGRPDNKARNDTAATDEDTVLNRPLPGVLANDRTNPNVTEILAVIPVTGTTTLQATYSINRDGSFTYNPTNTEDLQTLAVGENVYDSFSYTLADGDPDNPDSAIVSLTVSGVNDAPIAKSRSLITSEGRPLRIILRATEIDATDVLSYSVVVPPSHGTISAVLNNNESGNSSENDPNTAVITYTSNIQYNGPDSFIFAVNDGNGGSDTATINIIVTEQNSAPIAVDDIDATDEEMILHAEIPGVLTNDYDPDGDSLEVVNDYAIVESDQGKGSILINSDGSYTFNPSEEMQKLSLGTEDVISITYNIIDGNPIIEDDDLPLDRDAEGYLEITVRGLNDPPVAYGETWFVGENTPRDIILSADDIDRGDDLTFSIESSPLFNAEPLIITEVTSRTATVSYTPEAFYNGRDSFVFGIDDDNGGIDLATITVIVTATDTAPIAGDDRATTNEDNILSVNEPGLLFNDLNFDPNTLLEVIAFDSASEMGATVNVNNDGSYTYNPIDVNTLQAIPAGGLATDEFIYIIGNGSGETDDGLVTITVNGVNDTPLASSQSVTTTEGALKEITLKGIEIDANDLLTFDIIQQPESGSLTNLTQPATYSLTQIATIDYTPDEFTFGQDSFTYRVTDGSGRTNTAVVNILIIAKNDPPEAEDDFYITSEDDVLILNSPGLLANDYDNDPNDPFTIESTNIPTNSFGAIILVNPDGSFSYNPLNADALQSIPANDSQEDSFTYMIVSNNDDSMTDTAKVTIQINGVNDPPIADDILVTMAEDATVPITLTVKEVDIGDTLAFSIIDPPDNGSFSLTGDVVDYTPQSNFSGQDSFTFEVQDNYGGVDTGIVNIFVNVGDDFPTAIDDNAFTNEDTILAINAPGVLNNDIDLDQTGLTVKRFQNPSQRGATITVDNNGSYTYDPTNATDIQALGNMTVMDTFTYTLANGAPFTNTDTATVNITLQGLNDSPVAIDSFEPVNNGPRTITLAATDVDTNDDLTFVILTLPQHGTISAVNNNLPRTATVQFTPTPNFSGQDSFVFEVSDGNGGVDTAVVTIQINDDENNAPVAIEDAWTTTEDNMLTIATPGLLGNDYDPEGDAFEISIYAPLDPLNGASFIVNSDGSFTFDTSNASYYQSFSTTDSETFSFEYTIAEILNASNTATTSVLLTIIGENDPPTANDQFIEIDRSITTLILEGNDIDSDPLTFAIIQAPQHGTLTNLNQNPPNQAEIDYTPDVGFDGTDSFVFQVSDNNGGVDIGTVLMTIAGNDPPVIDNVNNSTVSFQENGSPISIAPSALVSDPDSVDFDGGELQVEIVANSRNQDELDIRDSWPINITVFLNEIQYYGTTIGVYGGAVNGNNPLIISFNNNATEDAVQEVLRHIIFENSSNNPGTSRTIEITLSDGDGATSTPVFVNVDIVPEGDAPVVSNFNSDISFTENGSWARLEGNESAILTDEDSNRFNRITATFIQYGKNEDRLAVRDNPSQDIDVRNGYRIFHDGDFIGTFNQDADGNTPLVVTFNGNGARRQEAQSVLNSIYYNNSSDAPDVPHDTRIVEIFVFDRDDIPSNSVIVEVNIQGINDIPVYQRTESNDGFLITEGTPLMQTVYISSTDAEDPDSNLLYRVTEDFLDGDLTRNVQGNITTIDIGDTFTQEDINNDYIIYVYDGSEINNTSDETNFHFTVEDSDGGKAECDNPNIDPDDTDECIRYSVNTFETKRKRNTQANDPNENEIEYETLESTYPNESSWAWHNLFAFFPHPHQNVLVERVDDYIDRRLPL